MVKKKVAAFSILFISKCFLIFLNKIYPNVLKFDDLEFRRDGHQHNGNTLKKLSTI